VDDINEDIPFLALAERANGFLTGRYTGTDMPAPVEYDDVAKSQQADEVCFEMANRVARNTEKSFLQDESHAFFRHAPYGDQL